MKPIIQEEKTGCAIASSATIAGVSYFEAKEVANTIGIYATDPALWSETDPIRQLLKEFGIETSDKTTPFISWEALPNIALLSTKWHLENNKPYWHWAVFVRDSKQCYVLDSKKSLKTHKRTDFGRIKPKWFIEVKV